MSWIKIIGYNEARGALKHSYDRVVGSDGNIDNVLLVHGLRPHTLKGHMTLYKSVLHHSGNTLPKWYLEALGVYVSYLNRCHYCVDHHLTGITNLIGEKEARELYDAIESNNLSDYFGSKELKGLNYAFLLTRSADQISEQQIKSMRIEGIADGEILEINQVVSYFNYVNRTVLGLGVTTHGDILGLSPNKGKDPEDWTHS